MLPSAVLAAAKYSRKSVTREPFPAGVPLPKVSAAAAAALPPAPSGPGGRSVCSARTRPWHPHLRAAGARRRWYTPARKADRGSGGSSIPRDAGSNAGCRAA